MKSDQNIYTVYESVAIIIVVTVLYYIFVASFRVRLLKARDKLHV